jgi:hypothetical protein
MYLGSISRKTLAISGRNISQVVQFQITGLKSIAAPACV